MAWKKPKKVKEEGSVNPMPFPQTLTIRYFQLVNNRQFTEAQRELQRIRETIKKTDWNRGYYRALTGMLLAQKNNGNQYTFLQNLDIEDRAALRQHQTDFLQHVQKRFHADYDRGYFSAWHDYIRLLLKSREAKTQNDVSSQTTMAQYARTSQTH
jgi:hypothetical protein